MAETCGACHREVQESYRGSVHGEARARGIAEVPTCTGCHGEHSILAPSEPGSLVNPARVSAVTCGRCHGDERLAARYNLAADKVPTFADRRCAGFRRVYLLLIPATLGFMFLHHALDFLAKLRRGPRAGHAEGEVTRMNGLVPRDRVILKQLWPRAVDLRDLWGMLRHNLGRGPRPRFGKFSYAEKVEYLAFMWGTAVMAASGLILWFNSWSLRNLPHWVSDAATALHWYEAILATAAILIWHFYLVIFDPDVYPMDRAWITGKTSAAHLQATRPASFRTLAEADEEEAEPEPARAKEPAQEAEPASVPEKDKE